MADYTYDERTSDSDRKPTGYWWNKESRQGAKMHDAVFGAVRAIEKDQSAKFDLLLTCVRLYGNYPIQGLDPTSYTANDPAKKKRARINLVKSVIDTVASKLGKERPRVRPLTEGGHYLLKRRAKQLGKFVEGIFQSSKVYPTGPQVLRDGCIAKYGAFKVCCDDGANISVERVLPGEVIFDDAEARGGAPRNYYQRKFIAREVAKALWPTYARQIKEAPSPACYKEGQNTISDMIEVIEAWHLPSGPKAKDGSHVICIENCTTVNEEWKRSRPPFAFFKWSPAVFGFAGECLTEELIGIQVSVNMHLRTVEKVLNLLGVPWIFLPDGSDVAKSQLSNDIAQVYTVSSMDQAPVVVQPGQLPPDLWQQLQFLIDQAYGIPGISRLSARSEKAAGLDSAPAQREYQDIESERFATVQQAYEQLFVDLAEVIIDEARELYQENKKLSAVVRGRKFIERISWGDVNMEDDQYELTLYPTSHLPKTPAGRFAQVQEWIEAGFVSKEEGMRLMDMPDLEDANSLYNAAIEDIEAIIEQMLYSDYDDAGDVYETPEATQNLQLGITKMAEAYLRGKHDGVPRERLELMLRWMDEANALIAPPTPPAPPPGMEPPPPDGMPMPPDGMPPIPAPGGQMPVPQMAA